MSSTPVKLLDPPSLGPANPVYANITTVALSSSATLITVAGQVATHPDGTIPSTLPEQIDLCLSKLETCLNSVDAKIENLTRFVYYFTEEAFQGQETLDLVIKQVRTWLKGHRPASCFLVVKSLSRKEFLCEFEGMAVTTK